MESRLLIERIAAGMADVPERAEVIKLHQHTTDELEERAKRLLATVGEAFGLPVGRADWVMRNGQTVVRMPERAWAMIHHASGAMKVTAGLEPMEALFEGKTDQAGLTKVVESAAARLNLRDFIARNEAVSFERLWSIKAAAADRDGKVATPVLCRIVGAYRHFVRDLPVWGPASIALKLAGGGRLDSISVNMRETTTEVVDRPGVLKPEQGARSIAMQLQTLMGQSKINLEEVARVDWVRFGYLSLPGRKTQSVLAPVYVAAISITGQEEAQGYVLAASATEQTYLPLEPRGNEAPALPSRKTGELQRARRAKTFESLAAFGQVAPQPDQKNVRQFEGG
jgi:hypothetical protein